MKLAQFENDEEAINTAIKGFIFDTYKAETNWNMKNFVADQVELIRQQVGDKTVWQYFTVVPDLVQKYVLFPMLKGQ